MARTPALPGYLPVSSAAREGEHTGEAEYMRNLTWLIQFTVNLKFSATLVSAFFLSRAGAACLRNLTFILCPCRDNQLLMLMSVR